MMTVYVATFYTHFDALTFAKKREAEGLTARLMPVPRRLSSSCGTCVRFEFSGDPLTLCGDTVERLAETMPDGEYSTLWQNH